MTIVIARCFSNGELDQNFGGAGWVRTDVSPPGDGAVLSVDTDTENRITLLAAGGALYRLEFDAAGHQTDSVRIPFFPDGFGVALGIRAALGWRAPEVVGGGQFGLGTSHDPANLAESEGFRPGPIGPPIGALGRLYAVGSPFLTEEGRPVMGVARYFPSGQPDTSWGQGGEATVQFGALDALATCMYVDRRGAVTVGGYAQSSSPTVVGPDFALTRLTADGVVDENFGEDGRVITRFSGATAEPLDSAVAAIVPRPRGGVVAVGTVQINPESFIFALAGYDPDGQLDSDFGVAGTAQDPWTLGTGFGARALAAVDDFSRVIVVGELVSESGFAVARYLPSGKLDGSFGDGGRAAALVEPGAIGRAAHVDLTRDRLIVAGTARNTVGLARWRHGQLDTSFGDAGVAVPAQSRPGERVVVSALDLDEVGRIVVAGTTQSA